MKIKTSVEVDGSLSLSQVANATLDTDKFLVSDGGVIKYRTGSQLSLDIGSGVFVPYTGATANVNLGEYGLSTGNIQFDTTPTAPPTTVGSLSWNDTDGTLNLSLKGESVTLQIGQETVARIVNKTATNITLLQADYQAVRVTGAQGQRPKVDLAQANNDLNSTTTLGLVTETILINQEGFITTSGQVREINTTGSLQGETWLDGDILYLSGTVAGRITNIKPIAPVHTVIIGFVEYAHAIHGKIFVKVDNGYELDELHNVSAIAPSNNEVLVYDTPSLLWTPKTIPTILGYTPANANGTTNYISKFTGSTTLGNSLLYDNGTNVGIGTTNPESKLEVYDTNPVLKVSQNPLVAGGASIILTAAGGASDSNAATIQFHNAASLWSRTDQSSLRFGNASKTEIWGTLGSNVGIGTVSPTEKLEINGYTLATGYKIPSGLSSWFLKADGTYDSGTYALDSNVVHLTGNETITGTKTFSLDLKVNGLTVGRGAGNAGYETGTALGFSALAFNQYGYENTAVGYLAYQYAPYGSYNTAIGSRAMNGLYSGSYNASIGYNSLSNASYISSCVGLGSNSQTLNSTDTNSIVIGANATGLGSNTVVLGDANIVTTMLRGNVGVAITIPTERLHVAGNLRLTGSFKDSNNLSGTSGQVLSSTGTGTSWITNGGLKGIHSIIKLSSGQSTFASISAIGLSTIVGGANRLTVYPYIPAQAITSASLYINVTTAVVGSNVQILIYSNLNGKPDSLLYQSTNLDCATTGIKTVTTTQTFAAGTTYWIGIHTSSNQTLSALNQAAVINIGVNAIVPFNSFYITPAFGTAPTSFGTPVGSLATNPPFIGITL